MSALPRRAAPGAVAHAESPLQLLSATEAFAAGLLGDACDVVARPGAGMVATVGLLSRIAPPGLRFVVGRGRGLRSGLLHGSEVHGEGDALSGRAHVRLAAHARARRTVLLDDGTSSLHVLRAITGAGELVRPELSPAGRGSAPSLRMALARRAGARLRAAARDGTLTVFTAVAPSTDLAAAATDLGVRLVPHRFALVADSGLRAARTTPVKHAPGAIVLLGSALATDGLIDREHYLDWVRAHATVGPLRYVAHRREDTATLRTIASLPGVSVDASALPAELRLIALGAGARVVSLPSTALLTLDLLLTPRGVSVEGRAVPDHWWTEQATLPLRAHLNHPLTTLAHASTIP